MNVTRFTILQHGLVAGVLVLALGACDSSNALSEDDVASPTLAASVEQIDQSLALSPDLRDAVKAAFAAHEDQAGTPGFLWYVADDLQESLTDEQKADLLAQSDQGFQRPGHRPYHRRSPRPGNRQGPMHGPQRFGDYFMDRIPDLMDDQRAALDSIRAAHREQLQALRQKFRDGTQDPGALRSDMRALMAAMRAEVQAVLTDEQKAYLDEQREERRAQFEQRRDERREQGSAFAEEARAVAADVMNLTDEQQQVLRELAESQREDMRALHDALRAGDIDPDAAAEAFEALHTARLETLSATLTPEQLETVQIHRVLMRHTMRPRFRQRAK